MKINKKIAINTALSLALLSSAIPYNVMAKDVSDVWPYDNVVTKDNFTGYTKDGYNGLINNFYSPHPYYNRTIYPYFNVPAFYKYADGYYPLREFSLSVTSSVGTLENKGIEYVSFVETKYLNKIGQYAFKRNLIKEIYWNADEFYTDPIHIGHGAFANNKLTKLELPLKVTLIADNAFQSNDIVTIKGWENVEFISQYAFNANKLISSDDSGYEFIIPKGIIKIYSSTFSGNKLTDIIIPKNIIDIAINAFANNPLNNIYIENPNVTIKNGAFNPDSTVNVSDMTFFSYGDTNNVKTYAASIGANYVDLNTMQLFTFPKGTDVTNTTYSQSVEDAKAYINTNVSEGIVKKYLLEAVDEKDEVLKTDYLKTEIETLITQGKYDEALVKLNTLSNTTDSALNDEINALTTLANTKKKEDVVGKVGALNSKDFNLDEIVLIEGELGDYSLDKTSLINVAKVKIAELVAEQIEGNSPLATTTELINSVQLSTLNKDMITVLQTSIDEVIKTNHIKVIEKAVSTQSLDEFLTLIAYVEDKNTQQLLLNDFEALKNADKANADAALLDKVAELLNLENEISKLNKELSTSNEKNGVTNTATSEGTNATTSNPTPNVSKHNDTNNKGDSNGSKDKVETLNDLNDKEAVLKEDIKQEHTTNYKSLSDKVSSEENEVVFNKESILNVISPEDKKATINTIEKIVETDPSALEGLLGEKTLNTIVKNSETFITQQVAYEEQKQLAEDYKVKLDNALASNNINDENNNNSSTTLNIFGILFFVLLTLIYLRRYKISKDYKEEISKLKSDLNDKKEKDLS